MIAILITTMLRDNLLFECLESIKKHNNNFYVVVVDQGYQTIEKADFMLKYFSSIKGEYIRTDFDIGALKARNIGIQRIKELNIPYTLMFADSMKCLQKYNFQPIIEFLESSDNNFLCGFNLKNSICTWECDITKTDRFELDIPKRLPITYKCLKFQPVDLCRNIFLCKTGLLYTAQYDEDRKLADHESSFWRWKEKGYKCFYVDSYLFDYKRDRPLEYSKFRDRFGDEKKKMMEKYNLKGWVLYSDALKNKWKEEKNLTKR